MFARSTTKSDRSENNPAAGLTPNGNLTRMYARGPTMIVHSRANIKFTLILRYAESKSNFESRIDIPGFSMRNW